MYSNMEELERKLRRYNQEHLMDYYNSMDVGTKKEKFLDSIYGITSRAVLADYYTVEKVVDKVSDEKDMEKDISRTKLSKVLKKVYEKKNN